MKKKTKTLKVNETTKNQSPKRKFSAMEQPYPFRKVKNERDVCDAEKSNQNGVKKSTPMGFAAMKKKTKKFKVNETMKTQSPKRKFFAM